MPQTWESVLNFEAPYSTTTGSAYASSSAATDVSPAPQYMLQPVGFMYVGQLWRFTAWGIYSTTGTPNLTIGFYYGGVAGTALAATAATATGSSVSNLMWRAQMEMRVLSLGSSGTVTAFGLCHGIAATASTPVLMPVSSSTGNTVTVNTTTNEALTCGATWGASSASNTLTLYGFIIETLTT